MFSNRTCRVMGASVFVATSLFGCRGSDVSSPSTARELMAPTVAVQRANTPERTVTDISRGPFTLFHCDGFDAIATFYGTVATTVFYDANGNAVRLINQYNTNSVITNSVTGTQIFGSGHGPDVVTILPDGGEQIAGSGVFINFRAADGTHLVFSTGRLIQIVKPDGSVETTFTAGPLDDYLGPRRTAICNALAD